PVWGARGIAFRPRGPDLWLIQPDGTGTQRLTRTGQRIDPVAWSGDGWRLIANEDRPPGQLRGIWSIDLRTHRSLHRPPGPARALTAYGLSLDGNTVLAQSGDCDTSPQRSPTSMIVTVPFRGGTPKTIVEGCGAASWNE